MSDKQINYAADRKYAMTHEWVKQEGDLLVIGISDYAQDQLGDVVFVELPEVGKTLDAGSAIGVVESVKAASDIFTPVGGKVEAANTKLTESPELLNKDPLGEGWLIKLRPSNLSEMGSLLDAATYQKKIEAGEIH